MAISMGLFEALQVSALCRKPVYLHARVSAGRVDTQRYIRYLAVVSRGALASLSKV